MNREEQRQTTLRARRVKKARKKWYSTQPETSDLSADELAMLMQHDEELELFKDYPAGIRRRMARAGQALPDGSFPIADCADAADAIRSIGRAAPAKRDRARSHIRKRVRALGCSGSIYENWR